MYTQKGIQPYLILVGGWQMTKPFQYQRQDSGLTLKEGLAELNALTGMNSIKEEINELVKLVRFYKETGRDVLNKFSLHSIFTGNPGTGKTTVARIVAKALSERLKQQVIVDNRAGAGSTIGTDVVAFRLVVVSSA